MYKTEKIKLAPILSEDSDKLFNWINDADLVHYNSVYKPIDDHSHKEWFKTIGKNESARLFSIRLTSTNGLIGTCQLHSINLFNRNAELQIRIGEIEQMGKGNGTEALKLLLKFGFVELGLNKIYLYVFSDNDRAINAYLKVGMKKEGILRQQIFHTGKFKDVVFMSILKAEFNSH